MPQLAFVVYGLKVASPEPLVKVRVLVRDLPPMRGQIVVLFLYQLSGKRAFRNTEQAVKMQPLLSRTPLPHPYVLSVLAVAQIAQRRSQLLTKTVFRV